MKQAKKIWNGVNVKIRDFLASLCFSGPSFLGMLIFFVAPFCVVIYYSFIAGALDHSFVGLKNYIAVWNNGAFQIAVKNTAVFSGLSVPLVDQQLGERLEALWNKDLVGLDPTDPDECNIEEYYQKMIGGLATVGNVYQKKAENLAGSVLTIENNRQQVIGVSSDEELQNMIKFQNAYNASSRFMTVISDMIEHIVTRLGNG